ncbi:cupredoxin family copper-binding protein [Streptomyces sp. NPDC049577]|uniref:cupredoxin domain-containing protein n=1 Tax=Streptomyces sp. NPDC049577 TaxID=3155153 RepID=UPI00344A7690
MRSSLRATLALLAALALGVLMAVGPAPLAQAATRYYVSISDFSFQPQDLSVKPGDTVVWTNADNVKHTTTSDSGAWDSGLLAKGQSFSETFTTAGTYTYHCTPHPFMTGSIEVG